MKWQKLEEAKAHILGNLKSKDLQKEIPIFCLELCKAMIKTKILQDLDRQNLKKNDDYNIIIILMVKTHEYILINIIFNLLILFKFSIINLIIFFI